MDEVLRTVISTLLTPIAFALAVGTAWILRPWIREVVLTTGLREVEVSKGTVKAKFDPVAFAQEAYRKQGMGSPSPADVQEVATLLESLGPLVAGRRILWVDNHPANNRLERAALVSWGVDVQTRRTTEEALTELRETKDQPFDLVISDWFRDRMPEGRLLAQNRPDKRIPILFYFAAGDPTLYQDILDEARKLQAVGATSSPRELLRWTFAELVRAALCDDRTHFDVEGAKLSVS